MTTATAPTTRTVDGQELPPAGTYDLDAGHSHVGFVVRHLVVAKTRGRFGQFHGSVVIADDPLDSSVEVEVEMASVDTRDEQRDSHLRSGDFFDVEQFPHHDLPQHQRHARGQRHGGRSTATSPCTVSPGP